MATAMQGSPSQQGRRILLAGMRFLLGAVFLGYLMVWILSPTNLWRKNWNVQVDKHANSTYFGEQGSTLLIFTFPILFIAALGCLYLHLGKTGGNYMERNGENSRLAFWKRPLLVKGPLGVVSAMELAFLAMFIALLIWTYSTRLTIRFSEINRGMYHHHDHSHDHDKRWQLKLRTSAYNLALVGNICCAFLFFPVTRGSSILPLVGLTSEASIKYHIWLGHLAMVLFTAHGLCYSLYWAITHDLEQLLRWDKVGVSNVAGEIALVFGIVMWVTVLPRIRRQKFELFFNTHQLYFLFLLFYVLHVGIASFALILPGVYLFLFDRYLRFLQSRQKVRLVSTRLLPCETLELNFTKSPGLVYTPASVVFVNVPSISSLQWHPFTVSSSCNLEPDNLSVIIKKEGTWSQKLYNMLSSPLHRLDVSVEGPYGPAAVDFLSYRNNRLLAIWRRPVLVKGPFGIVSATELAFSAMFMALLIWSFSTYLYTGFSNIQLEKEGEQVWEAKLSSAALRLGLAGSVCCAFLFFPVTRGSSILPLIGLTSEGSIKYHIWLGHIVMILFTAHGLCYIIYWAATNQISQMLTWDKIDVANVPGELALLSGLVMWITSLPSIRRKMFEIFYYTHHLYSLFLFFFLLHVHFSFFSLILPGVYLFLIDRYLRFLQSRRKVPLVSARILPCETIELNLSKSPGLSYGPLSIVFINVPSISSLQWHPFTVSSNSSMDQDHLSVIIQAEGSWSQKIYQMISSPSRVERMHVSVEGPYGPTSAHFVSHEMLVMVSGGSGITPFISIIRELIYRRTTSGRPSPQLLLICAFKNSSDLSMLDLVLPISGTNSAISLLQLRIEAFVTREKEPPTDAPKPQQTIWFKRGNSDEPIYAVLGPSSWLWLGIIISTSFVTFLLLLGILTRYYIYPIDHNTDMVYSNLSRSLLNMLFICVSIFATSSVVELWNRKQRVMEAKQIQNMEIEPTPTTSSPGSWFYSADRELESLPHQPLIEATITNVHYGARPELNKLILECQGSSIGVLASGPREMRHDVATICSSGLAHNLHFESISFSW